MAASGKFIIESNRFDAFDADIQRGIRKGLENAAGVGAAKAKGTSTKGYRIGDIVAAVSISDAETGKRGLEVSIVWKDFRAIFFEKGTYQNRRGKLKRARTSTSSNAGVKAVRFMLAARKAGADHLLEEISEAIR